MTAMEDDSSESCSTQVSLVGPQNVPTKGGYIGGDNVIGTGCVGSEAIEDE